MPTQNKFTKLTTMKKSTLILSLLVFLSLGSFAQVGIGIGSHGFNIKTNPDARTGLIIRSAFGIQANPVQTYIRSEAAWVKRHHYSEKTKLYAGLGISSEMRLGTNGMMVGYGALIPVGLELFPLDNKKLSLTLETGINYLDIWGDETHFGNYGLIEITFYLSNHPDY